MKINTRLLAACVLTSGLVAPAAAQKGPIEINWSVEKTSRSSLVVTPLQLSLSAVPPGEMIVDIASVGGRDITAASLTIGQAAQREFLSAPVNTAGVLTVEGTSGLMEGHDVLTITEIPFSVSQTGAQFGTPRDSPQAPRPMGSTLRLQSAPSFVIAGYTGTARLRITAINPRLAASSPVLRVRALGAVTVLSSESLVRPTLRDSGAVLEAEQVSFAIPAGERGVIVAEVHAPQGSLPSNFRSTRLYLLAGQERLYIGTGGFGALEIRQLDDERAAGRISAEEHRRRIAAVLSEGSKQTVRSLEPVPQTR